MMVVAGLVVVGGIIYVFKQQKKAGSAEEA